MAADVITRFKLETTQFDSKLRDTAKALHEIASTAQNAGKDFNKFSQKSIEAARALGTVQSGANNTKDRLRDLVGSYNDAVKAYDKLSDAAKQGEFGKAMAASLTQLQQRIKETKQELYSLGDAAKDSGGLFGGKLDGMLQVFGGNVMTKIAGMGVGFAAELKDMVMQGAELAKQGEGIRNAFERLGRGDILDGLRKATHGTVTDIELMKAAVKFNDFKLPVEELGTMLAFAQQKAKDTGQSIDYMVDSIVTGLGRKSLMILDNLGLSAAEIKEKMAETGDMTKAVGAIIREQMAKAGDYVETAADRAAQANVNLQNKMEELGRQVIPLQESFNNLWTSMKIGILDIVGGPLTDLLNKLTQAGRLSQQYGIMGGNTKVGRLTANLAGAREGNRQSIYQQQQRQFWNYINPREQQIKDIRAWQSGDRSSALKGRINAITEKYGSLDTTKIQAEVDAAKKMLSEYQQAAKTILNPIKADIDTSTAENSVASLTKKLKELKAERAAAIKAGDSDRVKNLTQQINATQRDIKGLDPNALKTTSGSTKNQPEYLDFYKQTLKSGNQDLKAEQYFEGVWKKIGEAGRKQIAEMMDKQNFDLGKDISKDWIVNSNGQLVKKSEKKSKDESSFVKGIDNVNDTLSNASGAINNIFSSLQQMGIEIPQGIAQVLGTLNIITSILTFIQSVMTIKSLLPFANGGIVPHAALGYAVPGNYYSGDVTPILANAGEVVLSQGQQNNIVSALRDGGTGDGRLVARLKGRDILISLERELSETGKGQLATWR